MQVYSEHMHTRVIQQHSWQQKNLLDTACRYSVGPGHSEDTVAKDSEDTVAKAPCRAPLPDG